MRTDYTDATEAQLKILLNSGDEIEGISTRIDLNDDIEPDGERAGYIEDILTSVSNVRFHGGVVKGEVLEANLRFNNCEFSDGILIENCEILKRITFRSVYF